MISSQQLGERLADARKRAKLTQAQVGEQLGAARTTIVAIEKGERRPSNAELMTLTELLRVSMNDLLREGAVRAEVSPRFRTSVADRAAAPIREAVERLRILGARYIELERLHGIHRAKAPLESVQTYRLDSGSSAPTDHTLEGEDAARTIRGMLGLGDEPATDLDERFETEAGLRIFYLDRLPAKLAAFVLWSDELGACVGINRAHPVERRRWSLTHELGHFLRDREAGDVLEDGQSLQHANELFPEAFAKEFLVPTSGVRKRFMERCRSGAFTPVDLSALAKTFGVSFQAMALRLEELRLLPRGSYEKIARSGLKPKDLAPRAPIAKPSLVQLGLPERYLTLAVSAFDRDLLSETEFAEILGTDIATARAVFQDRERISLDDGRQLHLGLASTDLRSA